MFCHPGQNLADGMEQLPFYLDRRLKQSLTTSISLAVKRLLIVSRLGSGELVLLPIFVVPQSGRVFPCTLFSYVGYISSDIILPWKQQTRGFRSGAWRGDKGSVAKPIIRLLVCLGYHTNETVLLF